MVNFGKRKHLKGRPRLAPLIDVVFLLLIFFLLTSTLATSDLFEIELPEARSGQDQQAKPLTVLVGAGGDAAVNNVATPVDQLAEALKRELDGLSDKQVMVKADAGATTRELVDVLAEISAAGIADVTIGIQPMDLP